jgi:hypothetical protein
MKRRMGFKRLNRIQASRMIYHRGCFISSPKMNYKEVYMSEHKITLKSGVEVSIYELVRKSDFMPEHLAEILTEIYNGFSYGKFNEKLAAALLTRHRTLQQSVIRAFVDVMIQMGKQCNPEWGTDPRNQAGIELCRRVGEMAEKNEICLPMI